MNRVIRLAFVPALLLATTTVWTQEKKDDTAPKEGLILDKAETIEFTTDEGTWMSLDVSPDGRTIAFDLLGDIYTLPIEGGAARRIIGGMSFESQPKFSPDGKTLAFLSDRSGVENLWLGNSDGSNLRPVTKDRPTNDRPQYMLSPSWLADGEYLLVSKSRPPEPTFGVFLYDRNGGSGIRIGIAPPAPQPQGEGGGPPRPAPNRMGAVASPDGRFVYYAERMGTFTYNARFPLWQIIRFDRETGDTATITNAQGSAMRPVLSPDGKSLVYATRYETQTGLRIRNLETGDERWLIYPVTRDDQESRASRDTMPGYAFMPDGKSLIVPIGGHIQRVDVATGKATPVPFTAKVEAEIAPRLLFENKIDDGPMVRAKLVRWPAISPDGRRVVFSALAKLWIMDLPNGKPQRLTTLTENEFMPTWSPDGKYIAFVTWSKDGGQIYRIGTTSGSQPERLSRYAAYYGEPVYTPDGTKIVFTTGTRADQLYADLRYIESGHDSDVEPDATAPAEIAGIAENADMDLRWIPAGGGESTLIGGTQRGHSPHFANDSVHIYLTSNRGLSSIRIDGFDRRQLVQITGNGPGQNPPSASEIRMAPNGRQAFVSLQNKHIIVGIPKAGKEVVKISVKGRGDDSAVPVKRLSREGGDYLSWNADGKAVVWALGSTIYRQALDAEKPEEFDPVVEAPRARPTGSIVLTGARLVTMKGAGGNEVIEKGDVVVTGNRIVEVGAAGKVKRPAGAKIVDVTGKTIIPGFVDVHAHMWPPRGVHQSQVWQYLANLAYGVTTTRDPQTSTNDVFEYADLVETGQIIGPRVLATGPGVFSSSGLDDKDATAAFIKRYKEAYKTDTIKEYVAGDRIVRQWIILAAMQYHLMPTTEGSLDMKLDLSQMIDGYTGSEHSLPIQPLYKDVTEFVARSHTFYTPTTLVAYGAPWSENYYFESTANLHDNPKMRRFIPHELYDTMVRRRGQWFIPEEYGHKGIAKGIADVVHAGGHAGLGSHGQFQGLGAHWEIWDLQSGGLTPHETLRVATMFGAEALGLQKDLGSVESGKLADLLVLDRNPLADIHNTLSLRYVMKNGELFESDTLDQIWPTAEKLEKQYWWDGEPATRTSQSR